MPVQLPPPAGATPLPIQLQDPPTSKYIANAIAYRKNNQVAYAYIATADDMGRAAVYEAAVIAVSAGGAVVPVWFGPAVAAAIAPLTASVAQVYNLQCANGYYGCPFKLVPFVNENDPTDPPHNLPPLNNIGDIIALTGAQATAYLNGYNIQVRCHMLSKQGIKP